MITKEITNDPRIVDEMAQVIYDTIEQLKDTEIVMTHYEDGFELTTENPKTRAIINAMLSWAWCDDVHGYHIDLVKEVEYENLTILTQVYYPTVAR